MPKWKKKTDGSVKRSKTESNTIGESRLGQKTGAQEEARAARQPNDGKRVTECPEPFRREKRNGAAVEVPELEEKGQKPKRTMERHDNLHLQKIISAWAVNLRSINRHSCKNDWAREIRQNRLKEVNHGVINNRV